MWEKFTSSSKRVIKYAHEEAKHFRNDVVDTEHLLLGLLKDENSFAVKALLQMEVNIEKVRSAVIQEIPIGSYDFENLNFSKQSKEVLELAYKEARQLRHTFIGSEHLLLGILKVSESKACEILNQHHVTYQTAKKVIIGMIQQPAAKKARSKTPTLDEFGIDLNQLARDGKLDPVVGRKMEIKRLIQILSKRTKNNPVLIGEPGVGKTAIVEGLAQLIVNDQVPGTLRKARMVSLDLAGLVAGTKFRGEFEDRLKRVMKEITTADQEEPIILFIDELHTVIGAGAAEGAIDASNILKPALSRGELRCIGATTNNEYKKYIERNGALERRFQPVTVEEPTVEETIDILYGLKPRYEDHHGVEITDESIRAAAYYSQRFITSRSLPDKAIDLLDEACSKVAIFESLEEIEKEAAKTPVGIGVSADSTVEVPTRVEVPDVGPYEEDEQEIIEDEETSVMERPVKRGKKVRVKVTEEDIAQVVHAWTGIPVSAIAEEETKKLLKTEEILAQRVKGQTAAIEILGRALRRARVGLKDPKRPTGAFLFAGPTGVGKTELAKALAEFLFGDEKALIRFDMSEYMERHSVSRLVGAPPGYVGFDEGGQLTEAVKRRPYSIILMDEIAKAHYEVFNILLQIMEDGVVTDSHGRHVDLKNCIIILTSNLGTDSIGMEEPLGFRSKSVDDLSSDQIYKQMEPKVQEALRRAFRPEFLNRLDEVVLFRALNEEDIIEIAEKFLNRVGDSAREHELIVEYTPELKHYLARKGFSKAQGARPLRRLIQKEIEDPLSEQLLRAEYMPGETVRVSIEGEGDAEHIVFKGIGIKEPIEKGVTAALPEKADSPA
ncbi:MAG: ATP-dependent Clp protease ATP-binding subunit [bacterium]|nr:ATP-dependent Clp protease ATP-binding subunit [bacterium]